MAETLKGVFAASMSVLKADLSLDIEATLQHSKTNLDDNEWVQHFLEVRDVVN